MICIIDFGSQVTHLISRRLRELQVHSTIVSPAEISSSVSDNFEAFILSGGPQSVEEKDITLAKTLCTLNKPILGVCYGHQLIAQALGGSVSSSQKKEYGAARLTVIDDSSLFDGIDHEQTVWMSHGDAVKSLPKGFYPLAQSPNCTFASYADPVKKIYGVQFHPEVAHTDHGTQILHNFVKVAKISRTLQKQSLKETLIEQTRKLIGSEHVIMGVSGGVDSLVASLILKESSQNNVHCIYVDTGLMRKNETEYVSDLYKKLGFKHFYAINAQEYFLGKLAGITDPEEKRKIIGHAFIETFEKAVTEIKQDDVEITFLGQGTIYPDTIESAQSSQAAAKIKSHHNLTLPEKMKLKLVEPLRQLYKDEVRELGITFGIEKKLLERHPFPGPGLAVRILGEITQKKLAILKEADYIFITELEKAGRYHEVWQALAALLPVKTVGVMGDKRTYEYMVSLRAVTSIDGMTADWAKLPFELLEKISNKIINTIEGVNRVVYDITQKPPGTIEYE